MKARVVVRAGGVLVLALAVACSSGSGGDGDATTSTSETTTSLATTESAPPFIPDELDHAGLVARLDEICSTSGQGGDLGPAVDASSSVDDVDEAADGVETRLDLMRQLPVPDDDQAAWAAVERAYDEYLTALGDLSDARSAGDDAEASRLAAELDGLRSNVGTAVEALGATSCTV
jgi:hypothetical protein